MGLPGNFNQMPPTAYDEQCGPTTVLSPNSGGTLGIAEAVMTNKSGGAADVGFGFKVPNSLWKAGQIDDSASPDYVDDTTDAQDAGTNDFALFTTTNNDGFLVQSDMKFNVIGMTVTTAEAGTPNYEYTYYNGSSMATLNTIIVPTAYTAADHFIAFQSPHDWELGATSAIGADATKYAIRVRATTAPSTAPLASLLWVVQLVDFFPQLSNNAAHNFEMATEVDIPAGASVLPYFGTADAANTVQFHWRPKGQLY